MSAHGEHLGAGSGVVPQSAAVRSGLAVVAAAAAVVVLSLAGSNGQRLFLACMAAAFVGGAVWILWHSPPVYSFALALVLSPFSGNWGAALGIPDGIAPDRMLLVLAILIVLFRAPGLPAGRRVSFGLSGWLLTLAVVYVIANAAASGTLSDHGAVFKLIDAFGVLPWLAFVTAPAALQTPAERNVVLVALVGAGAYIGLTTLFETMGLGALVWPKYILDPAYGLAADTGRARGPFAAAVQNGFGLYACAVVSAVAFRLWVRPRPRAVAAAVGVLCLVGTFLTLQRSVWLATTVASLATLSLFPWLRRFVVPTAVAGVVVVLALLSAFPTLASNASARSSTSVTVWERANVAVAAVNAVETRPLTGLGWFRFSAVGEDFFQQSANFPLVGTDVQVHNVYLNYAADIGLVGLLLWLLAMIFGIARAAWGAVPSDLEPWRAAFVAMLLFYAIVVAFIPPPTGLPLLLVCVFGAILVGGRAREPLPPAGMSGRRSLLAD